MAFDSGSAFLVSILMMDCVAYIKEEHVEIETCYAWGGKLRQIVIPICMKMESLNGLWSLFRCPRTVCVTECQLCSDYTIID